MKKLILCALLLTMTALGRAQQPAASTERSEWLPTFNSVSIAAALDIRLVKVPDTEAPRIVYDTKGAYTTKFRAEVKDKVLTITEKVDTRRPERTVVTLYYNDLAACSIVDATAQFEQPVTTPMFRLTVGARATLTASLDVKDLQMELTGKSLATLTGKARYLSLFVSTGKVDALGLESMSATVSAASSGSASLWVTDRFDGKTTTGGAINYKGTPEIVITGSKFMGGEITHVN